VTKSKTYHLPIGLIAEQGHESVCPLCWRETITFGEPGGRLEVFESALDEPHLDGGLGFAFDRRGRVDGWLALRIHVCFENPV
jgi:hypothetical protein